MKTKLIALALFAGSSMFAQTHFSLNIGVGGYGPQYYRPAPAYVAAPPCPGPGYIWVDGYRSEFGGRNHWVAGYWTRPSARRNDYRYNDSYSHGFGNGYRDFHADRDRGRDEYRGR